jgi:hypothetical protein
MALVNRIQLEIRMELWDIVRFQLSFYCYRNEIVITEQNLDCLTLLAISGDVEVGEFCDKSADNNIFKNSQSARTSLQFLEEKGLITTIKKPKAKKRVRLSDNLVIQTKGNIFMNIKILRVEAPQ